MNLTRAAKLRIRNLVVIIAMTLVASCTRTAELEIQQLAPEKGTFVWRASAESSPVGILRLVPGETREVSAARSVLDPVESIVSVSYPKETLALQVEVAGKKIKLTAADKNSGGRGFVRVTARRASGQIDHLDIPVVVSPHPLVEFRYVPPAGRVVHGAFAAGEFNGWSGSSHPLLPQPDGSFAATIAIAPGDYSYKFIIDGEWMADPSNPRYDSSGYGNSLLNVPGKKAEELEFAALGAWMPGGAPQGAIRLIGPAGAQLDPASIQLSVNNRLLSSDSYQVDLVQGTIVLPASGEARAAGHENYAVLFANDTQGRAGEFAARFDQPGAPRTPRDEVMYFAMTDRFANGRTELDRPAANPELHPLANYLGGDWAGIRQKIEQGYFDRLGVTTIWISPINKNTDKVERDAIPPHRLFSSYHGYWPVSMYETNPQFGSMEDLRALVDTAHEHGIAVLLDFVANHVHEDHPLIQEHPEWIVPLELADGRKNIRLFDEHPMTTWFDAFLPTLNYENNPELVSIMSENAIWWIEQTGADGFRHDAVKHIPTPLWEAMTLRLQAVSRESGKGYFQIGETISDRSTINRFVGPDILDGQFDFPLLWTIQGVIGRGQGTMADLATAIEESHRQYPPGAIMSPLIGNHDVVRFMALADGDFPVEGMDEKEVGYARPPQVDDPRSYDKIEQAFALLMALPGAPAIYYGDEIGITGAHDPDNRRMLPWDAQTERQQQVATTLGQLASARRDSLALRRGDFCLIKATNEELIFIRTAPSEIALVAILRAGTSSMTVPLPAWWGEGVSFEPIVVKKAQLQAKNDQIVLSGEGLGFGYWRLTPGR